MREKLEYTVVDSMAASGMTDAEIGKKLGYVKNTIFIFRKKHGIKAGCSKQLNNHKHKPQYTQTTSHGWVEKYDLGTLPQAIIDGIRIIFCPTRYAYGASPQRSVRCYE